MQKILTFLGQRPT